MLYSRPYRAGLKYRDIKELAAAIQQPPLREEKRKSREFKWDELRRDGENRRAEHLEKALHQQRLEGIADEIAVSRRERKNRVAALELELKAQIDEQSLELTKRRKEWELEHADRKADSQFDRMRRVQEMNLDFEERKKRTELELENLRDDRSHERELARIQALSGLSTEAMIATADKKNAALLADLKKHEVTQQTKVETAEALNAATASPADTHSLSRPPSPAPCRSVFHTVATAPQHLASDVSAAKQPSVVVPPAGGMPVKVVVLRSVVFINRVVTVNQRAAALDEQSRRLFCRYLHFQIFPLSIV